MKRLLGLAFTSLLLMTACEKEVISEGWPEMKGFYIESCSLQMATIDSVKNFSMKVDDFTAKFPESKEHSLFPKIQANVKAASVRISITIESGGDWNDEKNHVFDN